MKNSKDYSEKIKKLYRSWKKNKSVDLTAAVYEEPLEALVAALIQKGIRTRRPAGSITRKVILPI